MRRVKLSVEEQLRYHRDVAVEIPDEMTEAELENALDQAQRGETLDDFVLRLRAFGIQCSGGYDTDLSSPYHSEVECDEYEFLGDGGE